MRARRLLPLLIVAVLAALAAAAPADARTGRCVVGASGGPWCTVWTGKVAFVADGDTLDVDVAGDGSRRLTRVRVTGINATEQTVYSRYASRRRGECHALAATARFERLVKRARGRVRLAAQDPGSHSRHRARRSVAVRIGGRWRDVGATLLREGHALWLPNQVEWAWNRDYKRLADRAAARGLRLWNPTACGAGPGAPSDVSLELEWDAPGNDQQNPSGEWMRVRNHSARDLSLARWWVRDSDLRRFVFPRGAVVPAGGSVTVRVGRGQAGGGTYFWGLPAPAFENANPETGIGDGAYLFDPQGDLRAWQTYA